MSAYQLRYRQIHLDFHTSPDIPGIGEKFDAKHWQAALRAGHVNSITTFAKCHHGWSYHPTKVGEMHPNLKYDLLRAQYEAAKEIDVNVPIYLSAGVDDVAAAAHPEWREISVDGCYQGWTGPVTKAGFRSMCFMSPYLDYLCEQIKEVVQLFPECDGIFLDIIHQGQCCCRWCLEYMSHHALDAGNNTDRQICADAAMERYYRETTAACKSVRQDMPVFHNSGHIPKGKRDILHYFSHLELESLPTGGWGYDHFPLSANYCRNLDIDVLGMTGKFHKTWGEFGGFKHPNALRYECAAMLAFGSKCSVGDQLHPNGEMDRSTYEIIGQAYADVEAKEAWCRNSNNIADIAVLSSESEATVFQRESLPDKGAGRILLEEHFLFDLIDRTVDFKTYKLLILPDTILVDDELHRKLADFVKCGGKLLLTGQSGLATDKRSFAVSVGGRYCGESPYQPDYLVASEKLAPSFVNSPLVMYAKSQQVKPADGNVLAEIALPYFNRTWQHYCSHQHAPPDKVSEYAAALSTGNILYLAHPIFTIYAGMGAVAYREYAANAIRYLLGSDQSLESNLPSTARVTLTEQPAKQRYVLHLLYANTVNRGDYVQFSDEDYVRNGTPVEVIEELMPLHDVKIKVTVPNAIKQVTLEPQGTPLNVTRNNDALTLELDEFTCHQMIALSY